MDGYLLGLDLGTSGVKALLLPADHRATADDYFEATAGYPLSIPRAGWSEQEPGDWWRGVTTVIRDVVHHSGVAPEKIEGLALSGQMHGATFLDQSGNPLRPAILWNDQRSGRECEAITKQIGLSTLLSWVANPALPGFTAPKILWVRTHEPAVYTKVAKVLLPKDYINYRLTGEMATEFSDASGTLLFDVAQRRWSAPMLEALDLPVSLLPQVCPSTTVIGRLTAEAATRTGLRTGTPVVAGGADNACAAVGAGVVRNGQVLMSIGTSGTVLAPGDQPRLDPHARLHTFCHAVPDTWYLMGVVLSAGASLNWLREALWPEDSYTELLDEAAGVPLGSEGLLFLPYLSGERTPHGDPDARGVFFGLSLRHRRAHLIRSVLEGVSYALNDSVAIMRHLGLEVNGVRATGGGARSPLWRQILADVLEARLEPSLSEAGPAFGAALIAGAGVGVFPSLRDAAERLSECGDEVSPLKANVARYDRFQALYDSLYPPLADRFSALSALVSSDPGAEDGSPLTG